MHVVPSPIPMRDRSTLAPSHHERQYRGRVYSIAGRIFPKRKARAVASGPVGLARRRGARRSARPAGFSLAKICEKASQNERSLNAHRARADHHRPGEAGCVFRPLPAGARHQSRLGSRVLEWAGISTTASRCIRSCSRCCRGSGQRPGEGHDRQDPARAAPGRRAQHSPEFRRCP